jgi:RimJ/RimL family protein N-acetyltransferase
LAPRDDRTQLGHLEHRHRPAGEGTWEGLRHPFSYTQYYRIEASTETTNLAEQRSLEKVGFTREGVVRGACFRAGEWRDMVLYSIIRTDLQPEA